MYEYFILQQTSTSTFIDNYDNRDIEKKLSKIYVFFMLHKEEIIETILLV